MKKLFLFACLFCLSTSFGQWDSKSIKGKGKFSTKEIITSDYETVNVSGSFFVTLIEGNEGKINIKAEENLLEYIVVECNDGSLNIRPEKGYNIMASKGNKIEITVPIKEISKVSLAGSGDIISNFIIKAYIFKATLAGSGDVKLAIECDSLETQVAGSGDIELKGRTKIHEASVAGSGDIKAFELVSENSKVNVSGSGDIKVNCTEFIEARVAGSGDIEYKGNPKKVDTKVAGSGTIKLI